MNELVSEYLDCKAFVPRKTWLKLALVK